MPICGYVMRILNQSYGMGSKNNTFLFEWYFTKSCFVYSLS